jgi:hypothetical protein
MPAPKTVEKLLDRARSAMGRGIRYELGFGGRQPSKTRPDEDGRCDCSGFVAWCFGFDRYIRNPFYANLNGENGRGWFETTAAWEDIGEPVGILRPLKNPLVGALVVYPDQSGKQGHMGIVSGVSNRVACQVIHCSSSASNRGDAISESPAAPFINQRNTRYGWYEGLEGLI